MVNRLTVNTVNTTILYKIYAVTRQCTALWGEPTEHCTCRSCANCHQQQAASDCNHARKAAHTMFSCHHSVCYTLAAWIHDTLCPPQGQFAPYCYASATPFEVFPYPGTTPYTLCLRARASCTLLLCFSQPL